MELVCLFVFGIPEISEYYKVQTRGYIIAYCISWLFAFKIGVCSINFNLLFFSEQRYHAYFMEEVDSWMIISAGSFLCSSPSFCFCFWQIAFHLLWESLNIKCSTSFS